MQGDVRVAERPVEVGRRGAEGGRQPGRFARAARALAARWAVGAAVALAYVLATVFMTWPLAARVGSATPPGEDPLLQIWIARWVQHALVSDPLGLYDANIFHPARNTLAYSDSNVPAALLSAPAFLLTGNAVLAVNLLVLGTFVLAAGGMYALVGRLAGNRAAGFLAGLAYAFLPYRFSLLWHLNQLGHAWTPWVLLALVVLLERRTWRAATLFGLLLAVQALTSFYLAFQMVLAVGIALAVALAADPRARTGRFLGGLVVAGGLAAALVVPLALPYLAVRDEQGLQRTLGEAERYGATPRSYLKIERGNHVWGGLVPDRGGEDALFPGGVALLGAALALVGLRRRPAATVAALAIAAAAFVISLGPTWRGAAGSGLPLPYRFLFDHFPFFKAMRVPARFGILTDFAIVVLGGLGAAWAWERLAPRLPRGHGRTVAGAALTALLACGVLFETHIGPVPLEEVERGPEVAAVYDWLARQPEGPVMEFPAGDIRRDARSMYWSTRHWKPLVQGYSDFVPPAHARLIEASYGDLRRANGTTAKNVSHVHAGNIGLLREFGVRYVVLHRQGYKREDWPAVIARIEATGAVEPAGEFGEATVY